MNQAPSLHTHSLPVLSSCKTNKTKKALSCFSLKQVTRFVSSFLMHKEIKSCCLLQSQEFRCQTQHSSLAASFSATYCLPFLCDPIREQKPQATKEFICMLIFCSLINLCSPKALCKEGKSHHEAVKVSFRYKHDNTEHNLRAVLTLGLVSVKECKQCSHAFSKGFRDTHTHHA